MLLGAVLVFLFFPRHEREEELLAQYAAEGNAPEPAEHAPSGAAAPSPA